MLVLLDFWCNGIVKKPGDKLSKEDLTKIGSSLAHLIKSGCVQEAPEPVHTMVDEQPSDAMIDEPKKRKKKGL